MIASLPMYDRPETRAANERFWRTVRSHLKDAPEALTRSDDVWSHWLSPDLVLSQTCGLPYRKSLNQIVNLAGTPIYDLRCAPGHYFSVLVVRASDTRQSLGGFAKASIAVNGWDSQSGWGALWKMAKDQGVTLSNTVLTGSHAASAKAVAMGTADLAALDAVTWNMIRRWDAFAKDLRVLAVTDPTPALPFITSLGSDPDLIRAALSMAIQSLTPEDRDTLCLRGIVALPSESYMQLPIPPEPCLSPEKP